MIGQSAQIRLSSVLYFLEGFLLRGKIFDENDLIRGHMDKHTTDHLIRDGWPRQRRAAPPSHLCHFSFCFYPSLTLRTSWNLPVLLLLETTQITKNKTKSPKSLAWSNGRLVAHPKNKPMTRGAPVWLLLQSFSLGLPRGDGGMARVRWIDQRGRAAQWAGPACGEMGGGVDTSVAGTGGAAAAPATGGLPLFLTLTPILIWEWGGVDGF